MKNISSGYIQTALGALLIRPAVEAVGEVETYPGYSERMFRKWL